MYHFDQVPFACGSCGTKGSLDVYDIISADEQPEIRDKVLDGSLFEYVCPHCGAVTPVMYPLLYTDRPGKYMISLREEGKENFSQEIMDAMTCRCVYDPSVLKEKILLFDHGMDDRALEILKILRSQQIHERNPEMEVEALFYYPVEGEDRLEVFSRGVSQGTVRMDNELYEGIKDVILPGLDETLLKETVIDSAWAHSAVLSAGGADGALLL